MGRERCKTSRAPHRQPQPSTAEATAAFGSTGSRVGVAVERSVSGLIMDRRVGRGTTPPAREERPRRAPLEPSPSAGRALLSAPGQRGQCWVPLRAVATPARKADTPQQVGSPRFAPFALTHRRPDDPTRPALPARVARPLRAGGGRAARRRRRSPGAQFVRALRQPGAYNWSAT